MLMFPGFLSAAAHSELLSPRCSLACCCQFGLLGSPALFSQICQMIPGICPFALLSSHKHQCCRSGRTVSLICYAHVQWCITQLPHGSCRASGVWLCLLALYFWRNRAGLSLYHRQHTLLEPFTSVLNIYTTKLKYIVVSSCSLWRP